MHGATIRIPLSVTAANHNFLTGPMVLLSRSSHSTMWYWQGESPYPGSRTALPLVITQTGNLDNVRQQTFLINLLEMGHYSDIRDFWHILTFHKSPVLTPTWRWSKTVIKTYREVYNVQNVINSHIFKCACWFYSHRSGKKQSCYRPGVAQRVLGS